jgi:hypothetical protein
MNFLSYCPQIPCTLINPYEPARVVYALQLTPNVMLVILRISVGQY